jgi:hypothetical protein
MLDAPRAIQENPAHGWVRRRAAGTSVTMLRWGQPAPDFELPSTTGRSLTLAEFRGHDVVLGFYCYDFGGI